MSSKLFDIYNPTRACRIIYDGILNDRQIVIQPGKTVRGVNLSPLTAQKILETKNDLVITISQTQTEFIQNKKEITNESILVCYYDLRCSPPTYDFVSFLLASEMARIDGKRDLIKLFVVPGPIGGFRSDGLPPFTILEREKMRDNIVMPMTNLLSSCCSSKLMPDRTKPLINSFGYEQSKYGLKFLFASALRGIYPLKYHKEVKKEDYITITLRESSYWPTRNSNIDQWMIVAEKLGKRTIFVRDTAKAFESLPGFETSPKASVDVLERAKLYSGASLNLFTNNGPAWMCLFMGLPCAIFKLTSPNAPCTNDSYLSHHGFRRGATWPNLRPNQHVSWNSDNEARNIISEIERFCGGSIN